MATLTIEEGLVAGLKATAGITTLVSTRVYNLRIPQNSTLPCITIARVSTPRVHAHDSSGSAGTAYPRMQIDAWATTQKAAKQIADAVRTYLNGLKATITSGADSVVVQSALIDQESPEFDTESELYRVRSDYIVWHVEA